MSLIKNSSLLKKLILFREKVLLKSKWKGLDGLTLPAASLFYALLLALLISIISTALISIAVFYKGTIEQIQSKENILRNAQTGLKLLLSEKQARIDPFKTDIYNNTKDSIELAKFPWGLFEVAYSKAFKQYSFKKTEVLKVALLGTPLDSFSTAALYLKERSNSLNICGDTYIKGSAYLPESGVRIGSINGQTYNGEQLIYGTQKRSEAQLPEINLTTALQQLDQLKKCSDFSFYNLEDSIVQSFIHPTIITKDSIVYIDHHYLKGNICVFADSLIYVSKTAELEDVLLHAPTIIFEDNFQGTVQAFAEQYLSTGIKSKFNYPSTLSLNRLSGSINVKGIEIGRQSMINGFVLLKDNVQTKDSPSIVLDENSILNGQVYSDGLVHLKGTINGHISCKGFYVMTSNAYLENYLNDATINATARSEFYLNPLIYNQDKNRAIVKWLN